MPNRLANESSPYLLQHANNPVDWYPWCEEALVKSAAEDKPIFLSIGYSACHWCHVMEHESFEDDEIAELLNQNFVSIKVDREERPDLDQVYMQAVMAMQGQGGWPLSVFLMPSQEAFFGGTYWPPKSRMGMPGFDHVLQSVLNAFHQNREQVEGHCRQLTQMLRIQLQGEVSTVQFSSEWCDRAAAQLERRFDSTYGGFGGAPKFPHTMDLSLLLQRSQTLQANNGEANDWMNVVETTLTRMACGGIYDHLGGGFARYSVDAHWLVPHFEKMLYDNAQLASVFLCTYRQTGNELYRTVCEETLEYLVNDMTDPLGGIYSTEDADSEGVEGKFYVWTPKQVIETLGFKAGERFCQIFDVTESGNFEGKSILNLQSTLESAAQELGLDRDELQRELTESKDLLLERRNQRIRPGLDDKVIVSWNGLAIDALAMAGLFLDRSDFIKAATRAAEFVWNDLRDDDGRLLHTWREGKAKLSAYLDDHANLANAFLSLFTAVQDPIWVERAGQLLDDMHRHFWDSDAGGFFFTADDQEQLIARAKDYQDNSVPSGNSMAAQALLRFGRLTGDQTSIERCAETIQSAMSLLQKAPLACGQMLCVIDEYFRPSRELVLCLQDTAPELEAAALKKWRPATSVIVVEEASDQESILKHALECKTPINSQPTLYVCEAFRCQNPLVGTEAIVEELNRDVG